MLHMGNDVFSSGCRTESCFGLVTGNHLFAALQQAKVVMNTELILKFGMVMKRQIQ